MTDKKTNQQIQDAVSSDMAKQIFSEQMRHNDNRVYFQQIISEYVDSVPFMEKVQKYAGMEIDKRLFTTWRYYVTAALSAVLTSIIAWIIAKNLH